MKRLAAFKLPQLFKRNNFMEPSGVGLHRFKLVFLKSIKTISETIFYVSLQMYPLIAT